MLSVITFNLFVMNMSKDFVARLLFGLCLFFVALTFFSIVIYVFGNVGNSFRIASLVGGFVGLVGSIITSAIVVRNSERN